MKKDLQNSYPFEPFTYKSIKLIPMPSRDERQILLRRAGYNVFKIPADKVTIDLLTDSGTGALSEEQWACLMRGDESYAQATSWRRLEESAKEFSGMHHILPVHQGRAAEKVIAEALLNPGDVAIANTFFDTTRANFEHRGARCFDAPSLKSFDISSSVRFKGDMDIIKLCALLKEHKKRVKIIVMTLTNNTGGGQPASLENIREVSKIAKEHSTLFLIDACRIAENAYFIWRDELKRQGMVSEVVRKTFALADFADMSAKKDGLANMGGLIFINKKRIAAKLENLVILYEGYLTYGGMSGREIETIAQGLREVVNETYLEYRIGQVAYLNRGLRDLGASLISPPGGHAVYIDAGALLPHIPKNEFPGQALASALYLEGGIRSVEIGSLMFGEHAQYELVRLALPRRVYTQSHLDYVIKVCKKVLEGKTSLKGYQITWEPKALRHFSCRLEPIS
jgi:tryptophanase